MQYTIAIHVYNFLMILLIKFYAQKEKQYFIYFETFASKINYIMLQRTTKKSYYKRTKQLKLLTINKCSHKIAKISIGFRLKKNLNGSQRASKHREWLRTSEARKFSSIKKTLWSLKIAKNILRLSEKIATKCPYVQAKMVIMNGQSE